MIFELLPLLLHSAATRGGGLSKVSARTGKRRKKTRKKTVQKSQRVLRNEALARGGTGQFTPGALSGKSASGTTQTVAPTTGVPSRQDFQNEFERKRAALQPQAQQPLRTSEQLRVLGGTDLQTRKTSVFGRKADDAAKRVVENVLDFVENLGNGDFARGMGLLITLPITAGSTFIARAAGGLETRVAIELIKKNTPAIIRKGASVKASKTIIKMLADNFKPSKIITRKNSLFFAAAALFTIHSILRDATSTKALGDRDIREEAGGAVAILMRDMRDDPVALAESIQLWNDVQETKASWIPYGIGAIKNIDVYRDVINTTIEIRTGHDARIEKLGSIGVKENETADFWKQYHEDVNAEEEESAKRRVDYFNSEKLRVELEIQNARRKTNDAKGSRAIVQAQELADFWLEYQLKLAELEELERIKQAAFWLEYRKEILKLQAESGRSRLNFGILG